ncbi:hypothetical protein M441DRAFT_143101, partial [Trichoderma asperellum CBS 433.97]
KLVIFNYITDLLLFIKLFIKVKYNSIFIVVCCFLKKIYFLLYNKLYIAEDLTYIYIRIITVNYKLLKEIILNKR